MDLKRCKSELRNWAWWAGLLRNWLKKLSHSSNFYFFKVALVTNGTSAWGQRGVSTRSYRGRFLCDQECCPLRRLYTRCWLELKHVSTQHHLQQTLLGQEAEHLQHGDVPQQSQTKLGSAESLLWKVHSRVQKFRSSAERLSCYSIMVICFECEPCTGIDSRQVIRCHFLEFVKLKMNLVGNRCYLFDD